MRNLSILIGALSLSLAACDKPSTTPPPGDTAGPPPTETTAAPDTAGGDTATPETGGEGGGGTEPGAPGVPWANKDHKQRMEYMGIVVLPEMKKVFQAYDGTGFAQFKCDTCHGKDGKAKNYEMPSNSIYPLEKGDPIKAAMEYDEKMTKFMVEQVTPKMAELLEDKTMTADKGAGCFTCHPQA
jgi:hypothetical protein